jgi:purine-binding chemotaxis protein CheW
MNGYNLSFVTFKLNKELYGISIDSTREVIQLCEITGIPNAPLFVDGVINLRGEIIPIIDLHKRFNFPKQDYSEEEELLRSILIINVNELTIGIIIDKIHRVISIVEGDIQPPPSMIAGVGIEYIMGVVKLNEEIDNLMILLNEKKLFSKEELLQLTR